ncbi:MAG TPA: Fic family protein [Kaistiaceae bacterium]|nr:Fic family protein [Kaistiaceae bacterium]
MTGIYSMEPMLPATTRELEDKAVELIAAASAFAARLNPILGASIGDLVRSMNCYYSNLIEGHNTHPIDIDRALADDYSAEPEKRDLQREARAHIEVQRMIDRDAMPGPVVSEDGIRWIHREFCTRLPSDLLVVRDSRNRKSAPVEPGEFRKGFVKVGRHEAPEPANLGLLLSRFTEAYDPARLSRIQRVIAVGASHHRLVWIHPFSDGNGRVARLFSHAVLRDLHIGSDLWSVSRGLARSVEDYKRLLAAADEPRHGDLDGRGNLTERGLVAFCDFFLSCCLDQVRFMEGLVEPRELLGRMEVWCAEEVLSGRLAKGSWPLLREAVVAGEFQRSMAATLTGYRERQARTVLAGLLDRRLLVSATPKGKVRLGFPIDVVERWLPLLYPAGIS